MKKSILLIILATFIFSSVFELKSNEMKFIENNGQWNSNILFTSQRDGLVTSVTNSGIYFDFFTRNENRIKGDVLKLNLINSKKLDFIPTKIQEEKFNYFMGNEKSKWVTGVNSYKSLIAKDIYEGVDFVYYIDNNNPRYDFVVQPYANIEQIALKFEGIKNINIKDNNVELHTSREIIENSNLYAYQIIDGQKTAIDCNFKLDGDKIVFKVGNYDNSKQLIIDPVIYSSYLGAAGDDVPNKAKYLDDKTIIMVGSTTSMDFRTTVGAYDEEYGDRTDAFVTKIKIENAEYIPVFTTYLGSLEFDEAIDVLKVSDYFLVTGVTESPDFPTKLPIQNKIKGGKDIFITSLGINGDTLLQSTFYGGNGDDIVVSVKKDKNNYLFFTAQTNSSDIQTVAGPPNSNYKGNIDILLFSLFPSREAVNLSAYLGGILDDVPKDVFVDPSTSNIYITGYTTSSKGSSKDFPIFPLKKFGFGGPYDETSNGGKDAFVMELTPNAQSFIISGFLGGDGDDIGRGIYADESDNIYIVGETYNNTKDVNFPTTSGSNKVLGGSDIFIAMFNKLEESFGTKLQTLNYSKLINVQGNEVIHAFMKNPFLNKFDIVLSTEGKFVKVDAQDLKAKNNIVFSEIEPTNGDVDFSKSYGGNDEDFPSSLDFDRFENYLISGYTLSKDFPISINSTQSKYSGKKDIVLIRNSNGKMNFISPPSNISLCVGSEVNIVWSQELLSDEDGYDIAYSFDAEHKEFTTIAKNITKEYYLWKIPQELSGKDNVLIRITHASGVYTQSLDLYKVNEKATIKSFTLVTPDTVCIGGSITFEAEANGTNVTYTWLKDNIEIGKTTSNKFTILSAKAENTGTYKVSIKNDCPPASVSENSFYVYVSPDTKVDNLEKEITKNKGETLEITANAVGYQLNYIWQKDHKNLPAQNGKTLKLSNLSLDDAGKYRCFIVGKCGIDSTNETNVIVKEVIGSVSDSFFDISNIVDLNKVSNNIYSVNPKIINDYSLILYDNIGNIVYRNNFNSKSELDLNNYSNGLYWLVITNKEKKYRTKLLKYN